MKTATLTARMDAKLKLEAGKTLKRLGLSHSSAISLFYSAIQERNGIPFPVELPNAETRKAIRDAKAGVGVKSFNSVKDLMKDLRS